MEEHRYNAEVPVFRRESKICKNIDFMWNYLIVLDYLLVVGIESKLSKHIDFMWNYFIVLDCSAGAYDTDCLAPSHDFHLCHFFANDFNILILGFSNSQLLCNSYEYLYVLCNSYDCDVICA